VRRHDLDLVSLMSGLVFLVLGAGWALDEPAGLDLHALWAVPVALVGVGLVGLAGAVNGVRRRRDDPPGGLQTGD
jgi:hypothetical protein